MNVIGYVRVSTEQQYSNLDFQIEKIHDYCLGNNYNIERFVDEIGSAYYYEQNILLKLLDIPKISIIMTDTSRFSRNNKYCRQMLSKCFKNKISLIFINENMIINNSSNPLTLDLFFNKIYSNMKFIENMIDRTMDRVDRGWDFRTNKYGRMVCYSNNIRQVVENTDETKIINLIKALKNETSVETVNYFLQQVLPNNNEPIEFIDSDGTNVSKFESNKLDYNTIANLLNSYGIKFRGQKWCINSINYVIKHC